MDDVSADGRPVPRAPWRGGTAGSPRTLPTSCPSPPGRTFSGPCVLSLGSWASRRLPLPHPAQVPVPLLFLISASEFPAFSQTAHFPGPAGPPLTSSHPAVPTAGCPVTSRPEPKPHARLFQCGVFGGRQGGQRHSRFQKLVIRLMRQRQLRDSQQ